MRLLRYAFSSPHQCVSHASAIHHMRYQHFIDKAIAPELLKKLSEGDRQTTRQAILITYQPILDQPERNWLTRLFGQPTKEVVAYKSGSYAWLMLLDLLDEKHSVQEVADKHPLPTDTDYTAEVNELVRGLLVLEYTQADAQLEARLADLLVGVASEAANHIQTNSNDYPNNTISAKIWMDGATLRGFCQLLADYKLRNGLVESAIDVAYYKVQITLSIMGHYPCEVGPDMVQLGRLHEQVEAPEEAETYYQAVVNDFTTFLADYEKWPIIDPATYDEETDDGIGPLGDTDRTTLQALVEACHGLIRLGVYGPNSDYIRRAEAVLGSHDFGSARA